VTTQKVKKVVIVGGGTAGWMAAAAVSKLIGKNLDISLVESDEIGTVGVGEATIPTMITLHQLLGINEREFMAEVQATFKLGIEFANWKNVGESYIHSFGFTGEDCWAAGFQHFWLRGKQQGVSGEFGDYCAELQAAKANKFAVLQRNHPPGGKTAAITSAIHAINHRNARITRTDKIRVQRMAQAGFYRVVSRSQRLRHHMAPKNPHAGLSARSGATEQIKLQPLEIHQCHKILNSIGHSIPAPLTGAPTSKLSCSKPPRSTLPSTNAPCTNALSSAREG